ncbi:MAG: Hpt domain-containing protein [Bacteroidales bacterium]|nr:Hpt domain-containing protein [Bacteroidales bacterium]
MRRPIDFEDLFNRVSDNREFANKMLTVFFETWTERFDLLESLINEEKYDEFADAVHQLKGILGNLAIVVGFDLLKLLHEEARLKNPKNIIKLLAKLKKELMNAQSFYAKNLDLFK